MVVPIEGGLLSKGAQRVRRFLRNWADGGVIEIGPASADGHLLPKRFPSLGWRGEGRGMGIYGWDSVHVSGSVRCQSRPISGCSLWIVRVKRFRL